MAPFKALMISKTDDGQSVDWIEMNDAELMEGAVTLDVTHSTINYKDGLAITGRSPVIRRWPMIPGVDFAGVVVQSSHPLFAPGDKVVNTAGGMGESHYGGYAARARVSGDNLIKLPEGLTPAQAMAIGTAGLTAMLCVLALENHGVKPDDGPVIVTGASGGVGSVAVAILAKLGYEVAAMTGRVEEDAYLRSLGAADIVDRKDYAEQARPLAKTHWAGGVDVAGSHTLANVLSQTKYGGVVAACGLAHGMDLPGTVAPFILRAVTLVGIESVMTPRGPREMAWQRLVQDLDLDKLAEMTTTHPLDNVTELAPAIVAGKVRGRIVLEV